jgi:hypothetical protein
MRNNVQKCVGGSGMRAKVQKRLAVTNGWKTRGEGSEMRVGARKRVIAVYGGRLYQRRALDVENR